MIRSFLDLAVNSASVKTTSGCGGKDPKDQMKLKLRMQNCYDLPNEFFKKILLSCIPFIT